METDGALAANSKEKSFFYAGEGIVQGQLPKTGGFLSLPFALWF